MLSVWGVYKNNLNPMEAGSGGIGIVRDRVGVRGCGMCKVSMGPSPQSGLDPVRTGDFPDRVFGMVDWKTR